jgi:hypothetical protein
MRLHRTAALIPLLLLAACVRRPDPLPGLYGLGSVAKT